ncbi:MAG: hypothetical protein LC107_11635 [Chitinophagales bacterium]|nr:hypothetical protein [Chitinophagales bacterium]
MIFYQSMEICIHDSEDISMATEQQASQQQEVKCDQQNHCCASKIQNQHDDDNENEEHHHCNGDFCKCISCAKVFLTDSRVNIEIKPLIIHLDTEINKLVAIHSYDFYPQLTHPPRV